MVPKTVAQPTNMEAFQALALECMAFISEADGDLLIDAPAKMPYVRSTIINHLQQHGKAVYLADSTYTDQPGNLATLQYKIAPGTNVLYERIKRKKAKRTVSFSAATSLISAQGQVLHDEVCTKQVVDSVSISGLDKLESNAYAETKAPPPKASFGKRVLQPLMLTAATTLTVYLFFTLRSESSNDGN
ncbi:MAG: hypothetical protein AB8G77_07040 [Rhodothermales bacterium]